MSAEVWAELTCGCRLRWDDPDEDVNGSFLCGCGLWNRIVRFV